jgi:ABC-2 type transport system ATP-binding protein
VRSLCGEGLSVLWTTHLLAEVDPTDRLAVLHQGAVLWQGEARGLAADGTLENAFLRLTGGRA